VDFQDTDAGEFSTRLFKGQETESWGKTRTS